ncbi:hypothetical protein ACP70R_038845 [Stipagrostis hirtigluma subsp. patula]
MSKESLKQNQSKFDHLECCKLVLSELLPEKDNSLSGGVIKGVEGIKIQNNGKEGHACNKSFPLFADQTSGLSNYNKERLKHALHEVVTSLNDDADEILGQILATSKIGSENLLPSHGSGSYEDGVATPCAKRRKTGTFPLSDDNGTTNGHISSGIFEKVNQDIQAMEESGETRQEAVKKFSAGLLGKLGKMAQGVDDILNTVASKCRPMTTGEKIELGKRIRKLPEDALNRLVEIITARKPASQSSDRVHMNLGELDNATLWRLYHHVEYVLKENKT